MKTQRLDAFLFEKKQCPTRSQAQNLIKDGKVIVNGIFVRKCGSKVTPEDFIVVTDPAPFVSRSGQKLEHALKEFHINVSKKIAIDVGASTGGFTECLLRNGIQRVYAIDVGTEQLHSTLRSDPRIISMEKTDIRKLSTLPEKAEIAVIDVSFISLTKILNFIPPLMTIKNHSIIALIKPQFESDGKFLNKKGVIKDPSSRREILSKFLGWLEIHNWNMSAFSPSPIKGGDGNTEYLALLDFSGPMGLTEEKILSEYF